MPTEPTSEIETRRVTFATPTYNAKNQITDRILHGPTALRVGPVDLSVMIQNRENQEPMLDAQVLVQLQRKGTPAVSREATRSQASNKLLYAALLSVPLEGLWNLQVVVRHGLYSVGVNNPLTVEQARSPLRSYWVYLAFPFLLIALFLIHQWLKGMRFQGDL